MIEITPRKVRNCDVSVPGSKSYTHRILIAGALSDGRCVLKNALRSEDTLFTLSALKNFGVGVDDRKDEIVIYGTAGDLQPCSQEIYLGNSGTSMRLLTAVAALGKGPYRLAGTKRMHERPVQDLLDGLDQIGVSARSIYGSGCPPVEIYGKKVKGGQVTLNCSLSSQFLSALLLVAPYTEQGLEIIISKGPVSKPYIDMTVAVMERMGVVVTRDGYDRFRVEGGQTYRSGTYAVESDCSQAGYFWAAAAITGAEIKVTGITGDSRQGDARFPFLLETMGCRVFPEKDGIKVVGGPLSAIEVDMSDMPDLVPTLAVVAAFAEGTTVIKNVAHLKGKESDRLSCVANELCRMGIRAQAMSSGLAITGGRPSGAEIETYGDHRMAMSFAVAGLKVPGVIIRDEKCVEKSFPNFWHVLEGLISR